MLRERYQTQKTAHICYDSFIRDIQNKHTYRDGELVVGCQRLRRKGSDFLMGTGFQSGG